MNKRGPKQLPRAERFAARTTEGPTPLHMPELGPCLVWTGGKFAQRGGYGNFYDDDGRPKRAHRIAWELATGRQLSPAEHVMHRCDNPICVRPGHLRAGDQRSNMQDMNEKGRRVSRVQRGEAQYRAVLTDEIVLDARQRYAAGEEVADIVAGFAHPHALSQAIYGQSWKHVEMPSYANRPGRKKGQASPTCRQGHRFTPENTAYVTDKDGYRCRYCKQCNRDRAKVNAAKRKRQRLLGGSASSPA